MIEFNPKNIKRWMMLSTRNAFGTFLTELAAEHPEVFVMSADFTKSTGLAKFKEQFPQQFLTTGIAEQNMIALASGVASEGHNVFASSFASFLATRCYEQIKINLGYMQHNVKLVGIASGLGVSFQGNTHYGLDDVSLMRAIPGMTIVVPSDCTEVAKATIALVNYNGPAYLRLVGEGFIPIVNTVVNMHTVKPLDTELINKMIPEKKLVVTAEEGQINGGLASAVAEHLAYLGNAPKMLRFGVQDIFPHAGSYQYLLQQCGLDVESIKKSIIDNIE